MNGQQDKMVLSLLLVTRIVKGKIGVELLWMGLGETHTNIGIDIA